MLVALLVRHGLKPCDIARACYVTEVPPREAHYSCVALGGIMGVLGFFRMITDRQMVLFFHEC